MAVEADLAVEDGLKKESTLRKTHKRTPSFAQMTTSITAETAVMTIDIHQRM